MKILEIISSISAAAGGSPRSLVTNVRAVHGADATVQTTICATDDDLTAEWRQEFEASLPDRCNLRVFPALGSAALIYSVQLMKWLCVRIREYDLVVIRKLFNPVSSASARVAARMDVPYVIVPHGTLSRYTFAYRRTMVKRTYFRVIERKTLASAAGVRFTSESEQSEAPSWGAATPRRVIPHPYESQSSPGSAAQRTATRILFLSRWHPVKGFDVLLVAFRLLRKEVSATRLVLAGRGAPRYERRVRHSLARLGIEEAVEIPGLVLGRRKLDLLRASSIFVLPSKHENFGMSVVEAMDAGLPVVISRGVNIWQDVEAAGAGLVLKERTPESLATALGVLVADASLRHEMGRRGQLLVRSAYNPKSVGQRLSEFYRAAAASAKAHRGAA